MDKETLFKPRLDEAEVEIPGVGTVRVRGLCRAEVVAAHRGSDTVDNIDGARALALERKMLSAALVDPELTEAEVGRWQKAGAVNELLPVIEKVQELSGLAEGASKSDVSESGQ